MIERFSLLSKRVFGGLGSRLTKTFPEVGEVIDRAGLGIPPDAYLSFMLSISILTFLISLGIGLPLALRIGGIAVLVSVVISIVASGMAFIAAYRYPSLIVGTKRKRIEEALPNVLSYMAILSSAGISPKEIFKSLAMMEQEMGVGLAGEGRRIYLEMELLGIDLTSALRRAADRRVSPLLSGVLEGIVRVIETGGDLTAYLRDEVRSLMATRRSVIREFVSTLMMISEIYMAVMVAFPLILIVMLVIMSAIGGGTIMGMSPDTIVPIVTYGLVPGFGALIMVYLDAVTPRW